MLETMCFAEDIPMRAELMQFSQRGIHCDQIFIERRRRPPEGRGVENSGLGITEGALPDGAVVPHAMSAQRGWEKNSLRGHRGHKVPKIPHTVGFKLGLHFYTDSGIGRRDGLTVRWGRVVQRSKRWGEEREK
jgi:hypothetical protein